ncbi:hypothetical protein LGL55_12170 [Clostridium tagluense]|uniref:FmdB family zinc ribbon protein n=1 Tax=Clostridium tagluense TaxID=360422 RepID=UPI001C0E1FD7|nr:hypothetical protein [Clostridium tagluense]MBU3128953.1 hypothetical protein [Clostridium tagluense]MCB2312140.1 hypothetical protein [Clostridium tagluense]MCB2316675.1 hypothetical protein [Clostridium tagluense]MCB2321585.1 hypothetical protein [Clostridium tagluense]MCB2326544.1 hypothetical protein [Clostridium tagluense]
MTYSYKCTNEDCKNIVGFDVEASINDKPLETCKICGSKVSRAFKSVAVSLNFPGSYNNTRK